MQLDPGRLLSREEYDAYKHGDRDVRRAIIRGRRVKMESAMERTRRIRAARKNKKAKRKRNKDRKRWQNLDQRPMVKVAP